MILATFVGLMLLATDDSTVRVDARLATPVVVLATALTLEVTVSAPVSTKTSPAWPASIGPFEVLSTTELAPSVENGRRTRRWELRLMSFTAGRTTVPPVEVVIEDGNRGARRLVGSSPIDLVVQPLPAPGPDDPLRTPLLTARLPWTLIDGAVGASMLVIVALACQAVIRRRRSIGVRASAPPIRPAVVKPAPTLDDLRAALPREAAQIERFYELAALVARAAISRGFGVATEALSARELAEVAGSRPGERHDGWVRWLTRVDRVRFGRIYPPAAEPAELVDALRHLVSGRSGPGRRR